MDFYTSSFIAYDTLCRIRIASDSDADARDILDTCMNIAHGVEQTLSMYDPESELSLLSRNYIPDIPCSVSDDLFSFLELNLEMAELTAGRFDPTMGPLVKLWNVLDDQPVIPDKVKLDELLSHVGYRHITLIPEVHQVQIDIPGIRIDPGASGKGFALELVKRFLQSRNITNAVLDFGGNLFVIGGKPDSVGSTVPWKAGIKDPAQTEKVIGTVPLRDAGIATSSWYEHYFEKDGVVYHHILDSESGFPIKMNYQSISVISSSALYTDILSTVLFLSPPDCIDSICRETAIRHDITVEYVAVLADGSLKTSQKSGFHPQPAE